MTESPLPRPASELLRGFDDYQVTWYGNFAIDIARSLPGGLSQTARLIPVERDISDKKKKLLLPILSVDTNIYHITEMPRSTKNLSGGVHYGLRVVPAEQPYLAVAVNEGRNPITLDQTIPFVYHGIQLLDKVNKATDVERELVARTDRVRIGRGSNKRNTIYQKALEALHINVPADADPYLLYVQSVLGLHVT